MLIEKAGHLFPDIVPLEGLICNILEFLGASPGTLFEGAPDDKTAQDRFYEENFDSFVYCLISNNDSIRRLATAVARKYFEDPSILARLRESKRLDSFPWKERFWRMS